MPISSSQTLSPTAKPQSSPCSGAPSCGSRRTARSSASWFQVGLILTMTAIALPSRDLEPVLAGRAFPRLISIGLSSGSTPTAPHHALQSSSLDALFLGESDSLVARSVGHAEGTRTLAGGRTSAYYGHVDPGNGVWNLGSFSYQHQTRSPEEADQKQMQRLRQQALELRHQAEALNLALSLEEELNGIDLANQAPLAALGENGYVQRLAEAYERQLSGADAIVWARTWAYVDPATRQLNAPGLGNRIWRVRADQARRRRAIADVLSQLEEG
ncbi:MAG: hypothetical protein ACFB4J_08790 [Elainellaceae cyanobacterium]